MADPLLHPMHELRDAYVDALTPRPAPSRAGQRRPSSVRTRWMTAMVAAAATATVAIFAASTGIDRSAAPKPHAASPVASDSTASSPSHPAEGGIVPVDPPSPTVLDKPHADFRPFGGTTASNGDTTLWGWGCVRDEGCAATVRRVRAGDATDARVAPYIADPLYTTSAQLGWVDVNVGYMQYGGRIYWTRDAGTSWKVVTNRPYGAMVVANGKAYLFSCQNSRHCVESGPGTMAAIDDGRAQDLVAPPGQVWGLAISQDGMIAITAAVDAQGDTVDTALIPLRSVDGGATWTPVQLPCDLSGDGRSTPHVSVSSEVRGEGIWLNCDGKLFRTTSLGAKWDDVTGNLNESRKTEPALQVESVNGTVAWASGVMNAAKEFEGGRVYFRTTNGGRTWAQVDVPAGMEAVVPGATPETALMLSVKLSAGCESYTEAACTASAVMKRTSDGGATWTDIG